MKARVKATGEIVNVYNWGDPTFRADNGEVYQKSELDFDVEGENNPYYWTRLEHQYAGMAMQGILGNQTYTKNLLETSTSAKDSRDIIVDASCYLAHALVKKMKEKEEK